MLLTQATGQFPLLPKAVIVPSCTQGRVRDASFLRRIEAPPHLPGGCGLRGGRLGAAAAREQCRARCSSCRIGSRTLFIVLLAVGFPLALLFAWIRRLRAGPQAAPADRQFGLGVDRRARRGASRSSPISSSRRRTARVTAPRGDVAGPSALQPAQPSPSRCCPS